VSPETKRRTQFSTKSRYQLPSQGCAVTLERLHLVHDHPSRKIESRIAAHVFPSLNLNLRRTLANVKRPQHDVEKTSENIIYLFYYL
jgi:hypothetical protein